MDATAIRFLMCHLRLGASCRVLFEETLRSRPDVIRVSRRDNLSFPGQFAGTCLFLGRVSPQVPHDFFLNAFESRGLDGLPFASLELFSSPRG